MGCPELPYCKYSGNDNRLQQFEWRFDGDNRCAGLVVCLSLHLSLHLFLQYKNYMHSVDITCRRGYCWMGIKDLPTLDEIDCIAAHMVKEAQKGQFILHIEHVGEGALPIPTWAHLQRALTHMYAQARLIRAHLLGTIVQYRQMDATVQFVQHIVLSLYKPQKPLLITNDKTQIRAFIAQSRKTAHA